MLARRWPLLAREKPSGMRLSQRSDGHALQQRRAPSPEDSPKHCKGLR